MAAKSRLEGGYRLKGMPEIFSDKPLVTVITVVFNGVDRLENTILSIVGQDYENLEYIVIDGGSEDGSVDVIRRYDDRIAYWLSEKDEGIYDAMNKGISLSNGEWLSFINCGDEFYNSHVLSSLKLTSVNVDMIIGRTRLTHGEEFSIIRPVINRYLLLIGNFICHQSVVIRRGMQETFDTRFSMLADYHLWLKALYREKRRYLVVDQVIASYDATGYSSKDSDTWRKEELAIKKELSWLAYCLSLIRQSLTRILPFISRLVQRILFRSRGSN